MGTADKRQYLENLARTLMGQLGVTDDSVGVDSYHHDIIGAGIRQKLYQRVFQDLRHLKVETLVRILAAVCSDDVGDCETQTEPSEWEKLHKGEVRCKLAHIHSHVRKHWLDGFEKSSPKAIIQHMAATAVVAAMYDIVVNRKKLVPVAS